MADARKMRRRVAAARWCIPCLLFAFLGVMQASSAVAAAGVQYVGDGTKWLGADIGAQINSAYAALPPSGGTIVINPRLSGGCYDYSTPIVLSVRGKYPLLRSAAPGGTTLHQGLCLNFTPRTHGAAITLDYADDTVNPSPSSHGMESLTLVNAGCTRSGGCGSHAIGIEIGTRNAGDYAAHYANVAIEGFAVGYENLNRRAPNQQFVDPTFLDDAIAIETQDDPTIFIGGIIAGNGSVYVERHMSPAPELFFTNTTFFSNKADPVFDFTHGTGEAELHLTSVHMEGDPGVSCHYIKGWVDLYVLGGTWSCANHSGTGDWYVDLSGPSEYMSLYGTEIGANRPTDAFVRMDGVSRVVLLPVLANNNFAHPTEGPHAANTTYLPLGAPNSRPLPWEYESPQKFGNWITILSATYHNLSIEHPCTESAEAGYLAIVTDAPAVRYHETFSSGSGSTATLAMCTGKGGIWQAM